MIYGGSKYLAELGEVRRILRLVGELHRKGRVQILSRTHVDELAGEAKQIIPDEEFDDEHIVAIVIASRCRVVCTDDKDAMSYLKRRELYTKYELKRPKIYCEARNHDLCCSENVVQM